jgi:DNA replication and repair protein RecF
MHLSGLTLDNYRNYESVSLDFSSQGAVFFGPNGSGKTNLLEAIYFLCTARSQRQASREEMIRFSSDYAFVEGVFTKEGEEAPLKISSGFSRDKKSNIKINDAAVQSFSKWFGHTLAIPFGPDDLKLVKGMPVERRAFIDVLLCQVDPSYLESLIAYKKNLVQRNALLARHIDDAQISIYEEKMAEHGAFIFLKRQELLFWLKPHFARFYKEMSDDREKAAIEYKPSIRSDLSTRSEWENVFYKVLITTREKDKISGFSSSGPHRDDVAISINGKPAKAFASQGQCTTLTLAMRLCSILCGETYKKDSMIFLFDDALTYLDNERTSRVFPLITNKGQIFVATSSDRDMMIGNLPHIDIFHGQVRRS